MELEECIIEDDHYKSRYIYLKPILRFAALMIAAASKLKSKRQANIKPINRIDLLLRFHPAS